MKRVTLLELIGHPIAHNAVQQLAAGIDPRLVAAQVAGNALAGHVATTLGVPKHAASRAYAPATARSNGRAPGADVVDAEYTVIDVTPGVRKKVKVG